MTQPGEQPAAPDDRGTAAASLGTQPPMRRRAAAADRRAIAGDVVVLVILTFLVWGALGIDRGLWRNDLILLFSAAALRGEEGVWRSLIHPIPNAPTRRLFFVPYSLALSSPDPILTLRGERYGWRSASVATGSLASSSRFCIADGSCEGTLVPVDRTVMMTFARGDAEYRISSELDWLEPGLSPSENYDPLRLVRRAGELPLRDALLAEHRAGWTSSAARR